MFSTITQMAPSHTMSATPAYTAVSTRRELAPNPAVSHQHLAQCDQLQVMSAYRGRKPPAKSETTGKRDWPQSVREYVARAFRDENDIQGIDRKQIEKKLKEIISEAADTDQLYTIDWSTHLLPQQLLKQQQRQEKLVPWRQIAAISSDRNVASDAHANNFSPSKKRKSSESDAMDVDDASVPPWRKSNMQNTSETRITFSHKAAADRFEKRQRKFQERKPDGPSKLPLNMDQRRQRFENIHSRTSSRDDTPASEAQEGPVVGTCQNLEKKYLRLTSAPKPETVRPLPILRQTLELLKTKWKKENNYSYICDQFKSLRQDLTVQHIKNEFTVSVYEIHARIALEKGDLGEYNQCQTQLRALYKQKLGGHPAEFLAYRILYFIYTCNRTDMNDVLADLTLADKKQAAVRHALEVRSALALGNFHTFFRLYLQTPNMGAYLMDMFIVRERISALAAISRAYKPDVPVRFLTEELGFETDSECVEFLIEQGRSEHFFEKKSEDDVRFLTSKVGPVFDTAKAAAFRTIDIKGQI